MEINKRNEEITLPRPFSASMAALWKKSKTDFFRKYFWEEEQPTTPAVQLGRDVDSAIQLWAESGELDEEVRNFDVAAEGILVMDALQVPVESDVLGYPAIMIADSPSEDWSIIVDHKASSREYTEEYARGLDQSKFYSLLGWREFGVVPRIIYNVLKTEWSASGAIVELTGETYSVEVQYTESELMSFVEEYYEIAQEISLAYEEVINPSIELQSAIEEYLDKAELYKADLEDRKKFILNELTAKGIPKIRTNSMDVYRVKKKSLKIDEDAVVSLEISKLEDKIKALKQQALEDGEAYYSFSEYYTIKRAKTKKKKT